MFKRAKLSVTRRRSKTIIFFLFLFIVANLVLSAISIKTATEESMEMARKSLGSEVLLKQDMDQIREEFNPSDNTENKDETSSEESSSNDSSTDTSTEMEKMQGMHDVMNESNATMNDVNTLKEISYVTDVKYYFYVEASEKSFSLYEEDSTSDEEKSDDKGPKMDMKMNNSLQVKAINTFKLEDEYVNGTITLTDGEAFDESNDNAVIISYELATTNSLSVGDKITITDSSDNDHELEIIGIYQSSETNSFNNNYNLIYVNTDTGAQLLSEEDYNDGNYNISGAVFYLDDPENADAFIEEANEKITDFEDRYLTLDIDNETYEQMVSSIEGVASFSNIVLIIVVIASIIVISLMVVNSLKDRNYEIGVLLSLGEKKRKIVGQFIIELIIIATGAFIVSIFTSSLISQKLADTLIENQTTTSESMQNSVTEGRGAGSAFDKGMGDRDEKSIGSVIGFGTSNTIDSVDVSVTFKDIGLLFVIGYGIILVSMVIPSIKILNSDPKDILSRKE